VDSHNRLSAFEIQQIRLSLQFNLRNHGVNLLGSQLGQFVAKAIAPRTVKSLGGIRSIVETDLNDAVEFVEPRQSDFLFRIKLAATKPVRELVEPTMVNGAELWHYFSNPNARCLLGIDAVQQIIVTPDNMPFASDVKPLRRMRAEDYRELALAYAQEQVDVDFREELMALLDEGWFYSKWINCLRHNRSQAANHLKSWEIRRTELVVAQLRQELEQAGLEPSQATVLADGIRPQTPKKRSIAEASAAGQSTESIVQAVNEDGDTKELRDLRDLLRLAVDQMSLADLKAIRVPVGILLALQTKSRD
jgi:hypothetical protein